MSEPKTLKLTIVSQEKQLVDTQADSVTAPTAEGEVTVLPQHIPLFASLQPGELQYRTGAEEHSLVVSKGFLDVGPDSTVTVIVDSAVAARDISEQKAQEAIAQARAVLLQSRNRQELLMAEASLKQALLELRVAQRTKKARL